MKRSQGPPEQQRSRSADVKASPWQVAKEHKSQLIFLIVTLGLMAPASIVVGREISDIRSWMMSGKFPEPSAGWPMWEDMLVSLVGCAISWICLSITKRVAWGFFAGICKEQKDKEVHHAKTKKMVESIYRCMFFTFATLWAFYIAHD